MHTFAVKLGFRSIITLLYLEVHSRFAVVGRTSKNMVLPGFYGIERGGQFLLGGSSSGKSGRLLIGPLLIGTLLVGPIFS